MSERGVRNGYAILGIEKYYEQHSRDYVNPHERIVQKLLALAKESGFIGNHVIDLCCGSGEVTMSLGDCTVTGVDPYTTEAYFRRTGKKPLPWSFEDIAKGKLEGNYDCVVCSFALHLCPVSLLPLVLWRLGEVSDRLVVLTPHKRPDCDNLSGWILVEELMLERVRMRIYDR